VPKTSLSCTLHEVDLKDPELSYHDLSYTWGDPIHRPLYEEKLRSDTQEAYTICDGIPIKITANLEAALHTIARRWSGLAEPSEELQYLWVDSICI
jgi:hypothetical protein